MSTQHAAKEGRPRSAGENARRRLLAGAPVTERRLQLAGVSTALLEGGDGSPVVFLQREFAAVWLRVIPDLVRTHRVIAPDLPGLGGSGLSDGSLDVDTYLKWLGQLIDQTCTRPPVLVGKGQGVRWASGSPSITATVLIGWYWWIRTGWSSSDCRWGSLSRS
jgi:pimeloyl-ACP methyl ester carboxylesterase